MIILVTLLLILISRTYSYFLRPLRRDGVSPTAVKMGRGSVTRCADPAQPSTVRNGGLSRPPFQAGLTRADAPSICWIFGTTEQLAGPVADEKKNHPSFAESRFPAHCLHMAFRPCPS